MGSEIPWRGEVGRATKLCEYFHVCQGIHSDPGDHRHRIFGGRFRALEAERRRRRRRGGAFAGIGRGIAGVVQGVARLRCDERCAACRFHTLDGGVPALYAMRITTAGRENGERAFTSRVTDQMVHPGNGFPGDGGAARAFQQHAAVRGGVAFADDRALCQVASA